MQPLVTTNIPYDTKHRAVELEVGKWRIGDWNYIISYNTFIALCVLFWLSMHVLKSNSRKKSYFRVKAELLLIYQNFGWSTPAEIAERADNV